MKSVSRNDKGVLVFTHAAGNSELGPNARWARFAEGLAKFDIKITLVGASFFHKYRKLISASFLKPTLNMVDGATFVYIWSPAYRGGLRRFLNQIIFSLSIFFMRRSDFNARNYDIVVASSPHPFVVLGALYWARRLKAKFVYESRDLWPRLLIQHIGMNCLNPYVLLSGLMEQVAVKNSDFILTPKEFEAHYYKEQYAFKNVHWVPNTSKSPTDSIFRKRDDDCLSIIYSGSLQSIYNVDQLINAILNLPNSSLSLTILGDGPELDSLKRLAGADTRIVFSGWLTGDMYSRALATSDICFFSTVDMEINKYGFSSNKISDYLSMGKPILAHVSQGAAGLIRSNAALASNPGDVASLAGNIQRFLVDPELIDVMGAAARQYYLECYEYDSVVFKLARLISK
ncbi:glycosyltransferase family 4 protein [Alphaproteobacteria bacterium]|nr:glycosyltransferase family 4 protein [Alphaproteobacteria bacterium]